MTARALTYGIWIPGKGWLKNGPGVIAFDIRDLAEQTALDYGAGACVKLVDQSLIDLEQLLLDREQEIKQGSLWHMLHTMMTRRKAA
jgi:hypothetical protein